MKTKYRVEIHGQSFFQTVFPKSTNQRRVTKFARELCREGWIGVKVIVYDGTECIASYIRKGNEQKATKEKTAHKIYNTMGGKLPDIVRYCSELYINEKCEMRSMLNGAIVRYVFKDGSALSVTSEDVMIQGGAK